VRIRAVAIIIVALLAIGGARIWLGDELAVLRAVPASGADARVDRALGDADYARLQPKVERSVAYVEELFQRKFTVRPKILIFATRASFADGLTDVFDYSEGSATLIATDHGGIFDPATSTIMVSLESIGSYGLAPLLEHELTHHMVREASATRHLPAWFEEGIATLAERRPERERWAEQDALVGRAIASLRRATFAQTESLEGWHVLFPRVGESLYSYAGQAVKLMRSRIEWRGVLQLLAAVSAGQTLAEGYRATSGETLSALEERLVAVESAIISRPSESGVEWTLSTGQARAPADVTIVGTSTYTLRFTVTTDDLGIYRGTFGSTAPPGTYLVSASGARAELSTDGR
jgi:hypothetical protein